MEMRRISPAQVDAFRQQVLANFEDRAVDHLRDVLADETRPYSDDTLRERVRQCITRAKQYGLTTERQVIAFAEATYVAGERFDTDPQCDLARQLLTDPTITPDAKAANLRLALPSELGSE